MRIIMMALVAILVLGGGGAGAYFYFMQPAEASVVEGEEGESHSSDKEKHAKKDEKHDKKGSHNAHAEFVELDPLILPIIDKNGVNQVVSLVLVLEVADSHSAGVVSTMEPRLKDAYIQDMYGMLNSHAALKGGVIQVAKIKSRLNKISSDVLGEDVVQDVLLQVVQQRPI